MSKENVITKPTSKIDAWENPYQNHFVYVHANAYY